MTLIDLVMGAAVETVALKVLFETRTWWRPALISVGFFALVWLSALIGVLPGLE